MLHGRAAAHSVLPILDATAIRLRRGRADAVAGAVPFASIRVRRPGADGGPLRLVYRPRRRVRLRQLDVRRQDGRLRRLRGGQHRDRVAETRG